jgi:hypothetical protein
MRETVHSSSQPHLVRIMIVLAAMLLLSLSAGTATADEVDDCRDDLGKRALEVDGDIIDVTDHKVTATFSVVDEACATMVNLDMFDLPLGVSNYKQWDEQVLLGTVQDMFEPGGPYTLEIQFDEELCGYQADLYTGETDGTAPHRNADLAKWELGGSETPCEDEPTDEQSEPSEEESSEPTEHQSEPSDDASEDDEPVEEIIETDKPVDEVEPEDILDETEEPTTGIGGADTPDEVDTVAVGGADIPVPTRVDTGAGGFSDARLTVLAVAGLGALLTLGAAVRRRMVGARR